MNSFTFFASITLYFLTSVNSSILAQVVPSKEVNWEQLNPARGDQSPQAGTLWGDRKADVATGFLLKPVDGFESPAHIHNVSYRGIVISGVIHNDDPAAEHMWMPTGSFWTQPAGESHITAAEGTETLAYIEIDSGPYLVMPADEAFDNGERPINAHESNIVWMNATDISWAAAAQNATEVALLWGQHAPGQERGILVKIPKGWMGQIQTDGSHLKSVVISGELYYQDTPSKSIALDAGSYFAGDSEEVHPITISEMSTLYLRSDGRIKIKKNK